MEKYKMSKKTYVTYVKSSALCNGVIFSEIVIFFLNNWEAGSHPQHAGNDLIFH